MTPEQHAKAIERAANIYATAAAAAALNKPGGSAMALEARESLREAIRAGVGAAPDSNLPTYTDDLELRYVEACEERDHLRQLLHREWWQLVQSTGSTQKCWCAACDKAAHHGMRTHMSVCPQCGSKRCEKALNHQAECSSAPKP